MMCENGYPVTGTQEELSHRNRKADTVEGSGEMLTPTPVHLEHRRVYCVAPLIFEDGLHSTDSLTRYCVL